MGGVRTGRDALELLAAGAEAVALGTVLFTDPSAPARIRSELDAELAAIGLSSTREAVGIAQDGALPNRKHLDLGSRV
jgi:dihydroorotate dehydrogenase (NAD+) catalytic subunit